MRSVQMYASSFDAETCRQPSAFLKSPNCREMLGMPYRLGGGDGHIDCIQMVYVALADTWNFHAPAFNGIEWYEQPRSRYILRDFCFGASELIVRTTMEMSYCLAGKARCLALYGKAAHSTSTARPRK